MSVTTGGRDLAEGRLHRSRRESPIPAVAGGGDPFQNSVPFASVGQGITQYSKGKGGVQRRKTVAFSSFGLGSERKGIQNRRFSDFGLGSKGKEVSRGGKPQRFPPLVWVRKRKGIQNRRFSNCGKGCQRPQLKKPGLPAREGALRAQKPTSRQPPGRAAQAQFALSDPGRWLLRSGSPPPGARKRPSGPKTASRQPPETPTEVRNPTSRPRKAASAAPKTVSDLWKAGFARSVRKTPTPASGFLAQRTTPTGIGA